jgi:hypothetical protein
MQAEVEGPSNGGVGGETMGTKGGVDDSWGVRHDDGGAIDVDGKS